MTTARAALALHFTAGLGPVRTRHLTDRFGSADAVLTATRAELTSLPGITAAIAAAIGQRDTLERADTELDRARRAGIHVLDRHHPSYPAALDALHDPPPVLWARGDLEALEALRDARPKAVAIVGTRRASPHARHLTAALARDLAHAGLSVVSGLARGIDTEAHRAAVDAGGTSVAALGCGADRPYPAENAALARRLTVLSAYPIGTPPLAHHFPARNRIVAALAAATVVVEGELTSGAMITADAALEIGRAVLAVPGRAGEPGTSGPHRLLRDGAALCETAADVLAELGWGASSAASAPAAAPAPELDGDEALVHAALDGESLLDDVAARAGLSAPRALAALTLLGLRGLAREVPGGRYARA